MCLCVFCAFVGGDGGAHALSKRTMSSRKICHANVSPSNGRVCVRDFSVFFFVRCVCLLREATGKYMISYCSAPAIRDIESFFFGQK